MMEMSSNRKYQVYKCLATVGKWILFAMVAFVILFPVYWIFISSITAPGELFKTPIFRFFISENEVIFSSIFPTKT